MEEFMKTLNHEIMSGEAGKGTPGCLFAILLMAIAIFLGVKLGPVYYNHYEFKGQLDQAVSRAGAQSLSQEAVIKDLIFLAERNHIRLTKEDIEIRRSAGRIYVTVKYTVPVDFIILKRDFNFKLERESLAI